MSPELGVGGGKVSPQMPSLSPAADHSWVGFGFMHPEFYLLSFYCCFFYIKLPPSTFICSDAVTHNTGLIQQSLQLRKNDRNNTEEENRYRILRRAYTI